MRIGWILVASFLVLALSAAWGEEASTRKIRLSLDGKAVEATLLDNATARDLLSLEETVDGRRSPGRRSNLAVFYRDFGYSRGLIGLGRIDSGIEALSVPGSLKVTIERVGK